MFTERASEHTNRQQAKRQRECVITATESRWLNIIELSIFSTLVR